MTLSKTMAENEPRQTEKAERIVSEFCVAVRGKGLFLNSQDHQVIEQWVSHSKGKTAQLVSLLAEILPEYYGKTQGRGSLVAVRKRVLYHLVENS